VGPGIGWARAAGPPSMAAAPTHILALYEPSARGEQAVRRAVELAIASRARLTVVTVAIAEPTDQKCCDTRSVYWNSVLQEFAADELASARRAVGTGVDAAFRVVSGRSPERALTDEAARCGADTVVVPRPRGLFFSATTQRVRRLQRRTTARVVLVGSD
jgi:nucleotide-binding universal stress UspA family protein